LLLVVGLLINTRSNNFIDLSLHVWSMLGKRVSTEPNIDILPGSLLIDSGLLPRSVIYCR
ncbi:hypothetical protein, partial [Methanoculleus sp.]|uniref:hypothetical protein n=1 Tax=Methanoculleus sp. TaxID=90427 RepID=UPI00272E95DA